MKSSLEKEVKIIESAAGKLMDMARKAGADNAEVFATYGRSTRITLEKQDFHLASSDDGNQLGLRVLVGERQGFAASNSLTVTDLKETAAKAVEIAQFSPGNSLFAILPTRHVPKTAPTEALWDDALADVSLKTQKEWAQILYQEAVKNPLFRLNDGSISVGCGTKFCLNSHGTHKTESQTVGAWSLMGMAIDGDNITSFDYFSNQETHAARIPARLAESTKTFRETMVQGLRHGPAKNYRGLVAFSPRAVLEIIVDTLEFHLDGRNVLDGTSRWKRPDIGKGVIAEAFTLMDNPWFTDRAGATFFDREGTPTANRMLINCGVVSELLLDNYAAKGLNLESSGNAIGGPTAAPNVGSHCLCLEPGAAPWKDLLQSTSREQNDMLLVNRFSGQTDPITGDFSGVAKGAQWLKGGEPAYYVRETLISGNVFELLNHCRGLSKEIEIVDSSQHSPFAILDGVSVTAPSS